MYLSKKSKDLFEKIEWLDLLGRNSGVGLWDAILVDGDAMHSKSRWTWSTEFRRLCGFSSEAEFPNVVGSWSDRLHPDDASPALAAFSTALRTGQPYEIDYRLKMKDGTYRWFHATGGVLKDEKGVARRACGSLVDVNAAKQAEADRQRLLLDLARSFEGSVGSLVDGVSNAAGHLQGTARSMSKTSEQASMDAAAVSAAAVQATSNVQAVATATEELSASILEISRQVTQASQIATHAVAEAERTNATVYGLAEAAQRIGDVVSLIQNIAAQTNLLALNASIEAARAGDAGKGFAVVASEVKVLANQTAKATEEIANQIGAIQNATDQAVTVIQSIGSTIREISEIAATIAAAVEEQGVATREIAGNVQQASTGTNEVSASIASVTQVSVGVGGAAGEVLESANELSRKSERLKQEVANFLASVRQA